jgi:hypothetical protein
VRRIVIAEMLILGLWALYLGIALTHASGNEVKQDSAWGQTQSQREFPVIAKHKTQGDESEPPRWGMPLRSKLLQRVFVLQPRAIRLWDQNILSTRDDHVSGGCNPPDSGSALQEATGSERRLLTCAGYRGSTGTSRKWHRTNSRSDSRYASRPGR